MITNTTCVSQRFADYGKMKKNGGLLKSYYCEESVVKVYV